MPQRKNPAEEQQKGSRKGEGTPRLKAWLFGVVALLIPVAFFAGLEIVLRIAGFGREYDLVFVKKLAGNRYYVINREVARRYFTSSDVAIPNARSAVFEAEKGPRTRRIFCLGGSTTAGFPYTFNGTFPSLLQDRLEAMFPDYNWEVVNVGISAINSYSVLDFVRELVRYEPDAFILYMGHNEFYGALGVASSQSFGKSRFVKLLFLRLEKLRLFRFVRWMVEQARKALSTGQATGRTLMEAMARRKSIPLHDPDYHRALSHFEANLRDILELTRKHRVPALVSTLVSNLRAQPPFISLFSPSTSGPARRRVETQLSAADSLLRLGKAEGALQKALAARAIDPRFARSHFLAGKAWFHLGKYDSARAAFVRARDLDALRFRASSDFNRVILQVCGQMGVPVVRMDSAFAESSPGGIPGDELFLEHLHPNFDGYFLMAKTFAEGLQRSALLLSPSEWSRAQPVSDSMLVRRAGVTPLDEEIALVRIRRLTSGWPFNGHVRLPTSAADQTIRTLAEQVYRGQKGWNHAHYEAAQHYIQLGRYDLAEREFEAVVKVVPLDFYPYLKLGDLKLARGNFAVADSFYRVAMSLNPAAPFAYAKLGTLQLVRGRPSEAEKWLRKALELNRGSQRLKRDDLGRLHYALAVALAQTGRPQQAVEEARRARSILPKDPSVLELCRQLGI